MSPNNFETARTVPFGPFTLDFKHKQCILPTGEAKALTRREMNVLVRLSDTRVRSAEDIALSIAAAVYPQAIDLRLVAKEGSIPGHIKSLRKKLGSKYIITEIGHGYMLDFK